MCSGDTTPLHIILVLGTAATCTVPWHLSPLSVPSTLTKSSPTIYYDYFKSPIQLSFKAKETYALTLEGVRKKSLKQKEQVTADQRL